jgi:hypothetical protein
MKLGFKQKLVAGITVIGLMVMTGQAYAAAVPTLAAAPAPCDVSGTPFLTITQNITNDPDSGTQGNWATDAFTENVKVWAVTGSDGDGGTKTTAYCANATASNATFVTTGPKSPEAGVALAAGITGTFTGGENYTFPGSLTLDSSITGTTASPQQLTLDDSSTAGFSTWVSKVFDGANSGSSYVNTYSLTYVTAANGTWTDADGSIGVGSGGDQGDITGSPATVYVSTSGSDSNSGTQSSPFATIGAALNAVADNGTIILESDITVSAEVNITKAVTLDGAGHKLFAPFAKNGNSDNAAIGIVATDNITIKNLTEDGTGSTALHGINIYKSANIVLNGVTVSNNAHDGIVVNGSGVTVTNLTTSKDGWAGVDVDQGAGVTTTAKLTVNSTSNHTETGPQILKDDSSKSGVSVVDSNNQYDTKTVTSGEVTGTIYTLKAIVPPPVVTPPTPTQTPTVTTTSNNFGTTGGGNPPASSSGSVAPFSTSGSVTPAGQVLGAATFHFTIELYFGMANNDVKQLQIRLNSDDNAGLVVDGIFGNFTKAAVMKWQTLHHLTADGIVGPKTIAVLNG